jgi:two-component system nitrogen regulation response regulator GlnG
LFLDEIGDMPFDLQTRLLRVLSDGHFYRVGGHGAVKTNVRVIAATHQNLEQRVKDGGFREDLFHRLNVIRLRLPALRERREDIPTLTRHFLKQSAAQLGVEPKRISEAALAWLSDFGFPGNVRQLENICHWLTVMAPAQQIEPKDLPPEVEVTADGVRPVTADVGSVADVTLPLATATVNAEGRPGAHHGTHALPAMAGGAQNDADPQSGQHYPVQPPTTSWEAGLDADAHALLATDRCDVWDELTRRFESRLILAALASTRGRRIEAAQRLGIGRNTITRKIQELGLE